MPNVKDAKVDPLLTNVLVGYNNEDYVASRLFPTVTVKKRTGVYFVRDKENLRAPADARRAEYAEANKVNNQMTKTPFILEEKSLSQDVSDELAEEYDTPFEPESNAVTNIASKLLIDKEFDLQATIIASGAPGVDAGSTWATASTDIAGAVRVGHDSVKKLTGMKANKAMVSNTSLGNILKNAAFQDSVKYVQRLNPEALRSALADWLDVKEVLIGDAVYNNSAEGAADSMEFIWSDTVILAHVTSTPALEVPTAGYELKLRDAAEVDKWYTQKGRFTTVRARDIYDNKVVDANCMYVITNTN